MIVWEKGETFESLQKREIQEIVKNMAIYFVNNTENVNNIKLNCLFYFADKMSIKEYVFPISRQDYFAYEYGPSPVSIRNNIINAFNLNDIFIKNSDGFFNTIPGIFFVDGEFCNNDLTILDSIINEFKTITWQEISKKACEKGDCM